MVTSIHNEDSIIDYTSDPAEIESNFSDRVSLVIDGGYSDVYPSTVVDCTGEVPEVIREGKGNLENN